MNSQCSVSIDQLVDSFIERQRRGEQPNIEDYVARHPELASEIRDVFPALALIENLGEAAPKTGTFPSAPRFSAFDLPPRLGDFRILREVGRGGMGVVYEAVQETLGRHVALKVLPPPARGQALHRERFRREAQAAAKMHHSNIVPVFAVGEQDGIAYYAMQFIQGQTLDSVLEELRRHKSTHVAVASTVAGGASDVVQNLITADFVVNSQARPVSPEKKEAPTRPNAESKQGTQVDSRGSMLSSNADGSARYFRNVAELGVQIAEALAYAHEQGLVHRDIKPSNLMLDAQGCVWVTDFGLAKFDGGAELTNTGDVVGTLRYMSPEQLRGKAEAASDLYSLGATLYELATLQPAFPADDRAQLIDDIRHHDPRRPRQVDATIPQDLETIVLKALRKEASHRYPKARDLAEDLRRFLADRPILARRAGWIETAWRWCRRHRAVAALLSAIAFIVVTGLAVSIYAALAFQAQAQRAENAEKDTVVKLWNSKLEEARAWTLSRQPGQRLDALRLLKESLAMARQGDLTAADTLRFRNVAIAALTLPDVQEVKRWKALPNYSGDSPSWDFDAKFETMVRHDGARGLSVVRVADDVEIARMRDLGWPLWVRMSPDGAYVAAVIALGFDERKVTVWRVDAEGATPAFAVQAFHFFDFSPDSTSFAYVDFQGRICLRSLQIGETHKLESSGEGCRSLNFSPDGQHIACTQMVKNVGTMFVRKVSDGTVIAKENASTYADGVAWHPSGRFLAFATKDLQIRVMDLSSKKLTTLWGHKTGAIQLAFDPTGSKLLSNDNHDLLRIWDFRHARLEQTFPASRTRMCTSKARGSVIVSTHAEDQQLRELRVVAGGELVQRPARVGQSGFAQQTPVVDPKGQFVVWMCGPSIPVALSAIHPEDGAELGTLELTNVTAFGCNADGELYTTGFGGLCRWPRRETSDTITLGPPVMLDENPVLHHAAMDRHGRFFVDTGNGLHFRITQNDFRVNKIELPGVSNAVKHVAISQDGRWVASLDAPENPNGVRVWDPKSGTMVKELPIAGATGLGFSDDGESLWVGTNRVWRTRTWSPEPAQCGHWACFSHNRQVLATGDGIGVARLIHIASGTELASLSLIDPERLYPQSFSVHDSHLYCWAQQSRTLFVWDLRLLRSELADLGLDWDPPALPGAESRPLAKKVTFELGSFHENWLAARFNAAGNTEQAIASYKKSLALDPNQPGVCRLLASLNAPRLTKVVRNAEEAMHFANRAVELQPDWRSYFCRALVQPTREPLKAIADLDRAIQLNDQNPEAFYERARCWRQLRDFDKAHADLEHVLALSPDYYLAHWMRGNWHADQGRLDLALHDWRKVTTLTRGVHADLSRLDMARAMLLGPPELRNPREAATILDQLLLDAAKNSPAGVAAAILRNVATFRLGDATTALKNWQPIPKGDPHWLAGAMHMIRAQMHHQLGNPSEAQRAFDEAIAWRKSARSSMNRALEYDQLYRETENLLKSSKK